MPRFRKKPVEVTAERIREATTIDTLEGPMRAKAGDWLITGVRGEKYSCDDEIFRETYEPVDEQARAALADRKRLRKALIVVFRGR